VILSLIHQIQSANKLGSLRDCFVLPRFARSFGIAPRNDEKEVSPII